MTRRCKFHLPLLQAVRQRARHPQEIGNLFAREAHALGVRRAGKHGTALSPVFSI